MARIPEREVERLKSEVSLARLVESAGVVLTRHGATAEGLAAVFPNFALEPFALFGGG